MPLILASGSPRRREILSMITEDFTVIKPQKDEITDPSLSPAMQVQELSRQKAREVFASEPKAVVIGSDTVVEQDGNILGKPKCQADAAAQLRLLSGRWHNVHTGVTILGAGQEHCFTTTSRVKFAPMTEEEVAAYIATGEPMDKAGSYGIQGFGGKFVESIEGDFYSIMGLPLCRVYQILSEISLLD